MSQIWKQVREPGSVPERIVEKIRGLIDDDRLKPGDRLPPERELATLLGVSRPSVREALRTLEARGMISIRHGNGVFVEDPSELRLRERLLPNVADIDELFAMREILEVPAASWAAEKATDEQLAEIRRAFDELAEAAKAEPVDWGLLQRLDARFHEAIVLAAGNRFMQRTSGVLNEIMAESMRTTLGLPGRLAASSRDHRKLMGALSDRDATAARAAARKHIRDAWAAARRSITDGAAGD